VRPLPIRRRRADAGWNSGGAMARETHQVIRGRCGVVARRDGGTAVRVGEDGSTAGRCRPAAAVSTAVLVSGRPAATEPTGRRCRPAAAESTCRRCRPAAAVSTDLRCLFQGRAAAAGDDGSAVLFRVLESSAVGDECARFGR
jgi:hypothetical protein